MLMVLFFPFNSFAEEKVRLTTGEWPPYISKKMKYKGLASRIITEAFAFNGIKVEFKFFPWGRAYDLAKEEHDKWTGSSSWLYTPERAEHFLISDPLIETKQVFFHLKSYSFDWKNINDLKGIHIGATIGYSYGPVFNNAEKEGKIFVQRVPSDIINYRKLLTNRIVIFPNEVNVGYYTLQNNFKLNEQQLLTYHPEPINVEPIHLLLSKKIERNKSLLKLFHEGLRRLKESRKFDQYLKESRRGEYL